MPKRYGVIAGLLGLSLLIFSGVVRANPHDTPENVQCTSCHMTHSALGPGLTTYATNENLCMSCHVAGGSAANLPFASSYQAVPGTSGNSHRWDGSMPSTSGANNQYGLRASADIKNSALKRRLTVFSNVAACSVCHDQHVSGLKKTPWDPFAFQYSPVDSGTATGGSTNMVVEDTSKTWGANAWAGYSVKMTGGQNEGVEKTISTSGVSTLTVSSAFPYPVAATDPYYISRLVSNTDSGTATGGSTTSVVDGSKSWTVGAWAGYYVKMTSGANVGVVRRITTNPDNITLTTAAFPNAVATTDKYYITSKRHYMRASNLMNDLCVDCHYYRSKAHVSGQSVRTWDGNKKSHPVGKALSEVADTTQFLTVPVEPLAATWAQQTNTPRYELNGGTDVNVTNNAVMGIDGRVSCLSCHGVHYTDSDSSTLDQP